MKRIAGISGFKAVGAGGPSKHVARLTVRREISVEANEVVELSLRCLQGKMVVGRSALFAEMLSLDRPELIDAYGEIIAYWKNMTDADFIDSVIRAEKSIEHQFETAFPVE